MTKATECVCFKIITNSGSLPQAGLGAQSDLVPVFPRDRTNYSTAWCGLTTVKVRSEPVRADNLHESR